MIFESFGSKRLCGSVRLIGCAPAGDFAMLRFFVLMVLLAPLAAGAQQERSGEVAEDPPSPSVLLSGNLDGTRQPPEFDGERGAERRRMVATQIAGRDVADKRVLDALESVPRHEFVPPARRGRAYSDSPLPIGHGQTISQPYIVGFMTEKLRVRPGDRVLEIGTGSGYQAAVLGAMGVEVVSIEIIEPLARRAADTIRRLGFDNIMVLHGDGYYGAPEFAPFDAIIVTAAAPHVPPPLIAQLKPGKRMVIPVGRAGWTQNLLLAEKTGEDGRVRTRNLMSVAFVPLTGARGDGTE